MRGCGLWVVTVAMLLVLDIIMVVIVVVVFFIVTVAVTVTAVRVIVKEGQSDDVGSESEATNDTHESRVLHLLRLY